MAEVIVCATAGVGSTATSICDASGVSEDEETEEGERGRARGCFEGDAEVERGMSEEEVEPSVAEAASSSSCAVKSPGCSELAESFSDES